MHVAGDLVLLVNAPLLIAFSLSVANMKVQLLLDLAFMVYRSECTVPSHLVPRDG